MTDYRLYRLDCGGHIGEPSIQLDCTTDEEAIERTRRYIDGVALELWTGSTLVVRFEATAVAAVSASG
jgi:hypothetical protein